MSKIFKAALFSALVLSPFHISIASADEGAVQPMGLHTLETLEITTTLTAESPIALWKARMAAKREARLERLAKIKARRLEASEKRKAAAKARLKVAKNKTKTKSIKTTLASTDKIKTAERPGWVRKDGKFIYRSARTIKAEQEAEAARKKELARQKAIARKKAARNKTRSGGKSLPKGNYNKLIAKYAAQNGIPYRLARAVVFVESSFRANATGGVGEIGLMQIRLATARGMGYKGSAKQLYNPATNLFWGMKYLGKAHRLAGGSTCGTILKYNAGHGAKRMNPISQRYCNRIRRII